MGTVKSANSQKRARGRAFGENLRALREGGMFSRHELAERAGMSAGNIVKLESGITTRPRRATVEALAKGLGVPVERLLADDATARPLGETFGEAFPEAVARGEAEGQKIREERARAASEATGESGPEARARRI
jgi:transcriptional regulator with XRE-family HTH domain